MEARKEAFVASMLERKLVALHADYEATIAADRRQPEIPEPDPQPESEYRQVGEQPDAQEEDDWANAEFQSGPNNEAEVEEAPVPLQPLPARIETTLDAAQVEYIKNVMSGIKLKAPSWLANVPEDIWMNNITASLTASNNPPVLDNPSTNNPKLLQTEYVTITSKPKPKTKVKKTRAKPKRANYEASNPNIANHDVPYSNDKAKNAVEIGGKQNAGGNSLPVASIAAKLDADAEVEVLTVETLLVETEYVSVGVHIHTQGSPDACEV